MNLQRFSHATILILRAWIAVIIAFLWRKTISIFWRSSTAPPHPGDRKISSSWLTSVLRERNLLEKNIHVTSAELNELSENRGLAATMARVMVRYSDEKSTTAPKTFVMKTTQDGYNGRLTTIAGGRHREGMIYASEFASDPHISKILPRAYYAYGSALRGESLLLMEDLKLRHFSVGVNMVMGNQIWGVPKDAVNPPRDPVEVLEMVYERAADMHAPYWNDKRLMNCDWLKGVGWYKGTNRAEWERGMEVSRRSWQSVVRRFRAKQLEVRLNEKLIQFMNDSFAHASWERLQEHLHDPKVPFTLCHGDFHSSNMMISRATKNAPDELILFDWSEVGPWEPTTDLAQMIVSDVPMDRWRPVGKQVVRKYWDRLVKNGVNANEYPFDWCWASFCRGGAERWVWFLGLLADWPGLPTAAGQYFHDQLFAWIEEYQLYPYVVPKPVVCLP